MKDEISCREHFTWGTPAIEGIHFQGRVNLITMAGLSMWGYCGWCSLGSKVGVAPGLPSTV